MAKNFYICTNCETEYPKWTGKCNSCGEWNSIVITQKTSNSTQRNIENIFNIQEILKINNDCPRRTTNCPELDKLLGGGIIPGAAILIGGEPGIGKSTLMTQLAINTKNSLYISAEESIEQISLRIKRMDYKSDSSFFASSSKLEDIMTTINNNKQIQIVFLDSIQTIYSQEINSTPGSIAQVKHCTHKLIEYAKPLGITLLIISHVNKDGQIAGPKVLEHMVDTVLYFEGDSYNYHRILRTIKNRFGPANEIAIFLMNEKGLQEVTNPSSVFITGEGSNTSGSVIFAGIEGSKPILLEIQALLAPTYMATPRRAVVGWDINRLAMIIAILNTRCGLFLADKEIYLNVAGGFKITETAADMAVAAALISAACNKKLPSKTVVFGEIGLSGISRKTQCSEKRLQESKKLGFINAIIPQQENTKNILNNIPINHISRLRSYIEKEGVDSK